MIDVGCVDTITRWLDTTIPSMTVAEHEAEVAKLRAENEELKKQVNLLKFNVDLLTKTKPLPTTDWE